MLMEDEVKAVKINQWDLGFVDGGNCLSLYKSSSRVGT